MTGLKLASSPFSVQGGKTDTSPEEVDFRSGSWSFFGFETGLNSVTGDLDWDPFNIGEVDWSSFASQKAQLDAAPANIFRYTRELNQAYLDIYEANQWVYVS